MEAVAHLLSRPVLAPHLEFQPKKVWDTASKETRVYGDMSHGQWWWDVQVRIYICAQV
jgi:Plavaka transposase